MFGIRGTESKIRAYVRDRFHDDARAAFDHYAAGGSWDAAAVLQFLEDAGVRPAVYRMLLTQLAFYHLDADGDGRISFDEFEKGFGPQP